MAILAALNSEEVEVIGITTIFGNVKTSTATDNAFILLNLAGKGEVCILVALGYSLGQNLVLLNALRQEVHVLCVCRCLWQRARPPH